MSRFLLLALVALCACLQVSAFAPRSRAVAARTILSADDQNIKDLNLEEMFDVFEEADKKVSDKSVKMSGSTSSFNAKNEAGISGPFGFFDPVGLCPKDRASFQKFRESELKHGRVAMLAFAGIVAGELFPVLFGSEISGPAIFQYQQAEGIFNAWSANVIGLTLAVEGYNIVNGWKGPGESEGIIADLKSDYLAGDLKFDPLGFGGKTNKELQTKEINNGRLAMLGVAGIVAQELVTGQSIF